MTKNSNSTTQTGLRYRVVKKAAWGWVIEGPGDWQSRPIETNGLARAIANGLEAGLDAGAATAKACGLVVDGRILLA